MCKVNLIHNNNQIVSIKEIMIDYYKMLNIMVESIEIDL